jgi:hypothetical protein
MKKYKESLIGAGAKAKCTLASFVLVLLNCRHLTVCDLLQTRMTRVT